LSLYCSFVVSQTNRLHIFAVVYEKESEGDIDSGGVNTAGGGCDAVFGTIFASVLAAVFLSSTPSDTGNNNL
jgi:hypothetical protein